MARPPSGAYGQCWSCVSDLTSPAVYVSGNRAIGEAIARRLSTVRGGLIDDPTYGYALTEFLNDDLSTGDIARIQANTQAECLKDERVAEADVTVSLVGTTLGVSIQVTTVTGQTFALVLSVAEVAVNPVQILSVTP